jgi:hypothetical protein
VPLTRHRRRENRWGNHLWEIDPTRCGRCVTKGSRRVPPGVGRGGAHLCMKEKHKSDHSRTSRKEEETMRGCIVCTRVLMCGQPSLRHDLWYHQANLLYFLEVMQASSGGTQQRGDSAIRLGRWLVSVGASPLFILRSRVNSPLLDDAGGLLYATEMMRSVISKMGIFERHGIVDLPRA